jgi:hypothetical protein
MSVLKKLQHEFLLVLPPTIFFFMGFTLISITQRLILREHDMPLTGFAISNMSHPCGGSTGILRKPINTCWRKWSGPISG